MISKKLKYLSVFTISILLIVQTITIAKGDEKDKGKNVFQKPLDQVAHTYLNINNLSTQFYNNGISDIDQSGNSGLFFPKGSGKTAVFTSGLLWGGLVQGDPQPRVGGTAYRTGLQPGVILPNGEADDPGLDKYRVYRVRSDVFPGGPASDFSSEVGDEGTSESAIRAQYELDWTEWPDDLGAPYNDVDNSGTYDPTVDIPGFPGANQTIWFVANDMNSARTSNLYGAQPIGIEVQVTVWAYSQTGALGSMYFRKYTLINKGFQQNTVNDMYVSMWSDVDLGDAGDDFVGVDTVLSLQYCYNASGSDQTYNPLPPPAVGFDFFQGPIVDSPGDSAIFNGVRVYDKKNLPMTAAYYFANGDPNIGDPPQGDIAGSTEFYNFFRGRFGINGQQFTDLSTGLPTTFALSGDPQTRTGWVDGDQLPPGDRRLGSASGPFTLAPGDTQEVVVAEICAGAVPGVDRISAIGLLKFFDLQAQVAYDNFFDLPVAPPAPAIGPTYPGTVVELDKEIVLDWSKDNNKFLETENFVNKGYEFQGYNIYQLPNAAANISEGIRIATYDVIDFIGRINDLVFDPTTGSVVTLPVQFGNDTGIKRFISVKQDAFTQRPLINGIKYYFAVTAYSYNPDPVAVPNNLENPINIITITPHSNNPGVSLGEDSGEGVDITHAGTADGIVTATIVDPAATTGDKYEVYFSNQAQIRNENGDWVPASTTVLGKSAGPDTLSESTIDIAAVFGADGVSVDLQFHLEILHTAGGWGDGVSLTFPAGVTILSAPSFEAGGGTVTPEIVGNVVNMGLINHEYTQNGIFHEGGENWIITVAGPLTLPVSVDWIVFDDGFPSDPVDAVGTTTIATIGFASRTAELWNLRNVTTVQVLLENQSVYAGFDRWPPRDDLAQSDINIGLDAMPIVDGFQLNVDVGFVAPITFFSLDLQPDDSPTTLSSNSTNANLDIQNYTIFGGTITSKSIDNFGAGTDVLEELQKDYELRFTGVWDSVVVGAQTQYFVASGGQMATIFSTVTGAAGLANHPMNPSPGTASPFLIRIPFEVWSIDDNRQVNLAFRDREQAPDANPFYAWDLNNRMYAVLINSAYNETTPTPPNGDATWVLVLYGTNYNMNFAPGQHDVVTVTYANPIQIGIDTYSFNTIESAFSNSLAQEEVKKINVFPNPYYGINSEELNKYNRFVTFNHLPEKATIRIFNLAGVLVKTVDKDDLTQFARWDLNNESNLPAASGLYIAYIEMPDLGATKILKIAIIQEEQILDRF